MARLSLLNLIQYKKERLNHSFVFRRVSCLAAARFALFDLLCTPPLRIIGWQACKFRRSCRLDIWFSILVLFVIHSAPVSHEHAWYWRQKHRKFKSINNRWLRYILGCTCSLLPIIFIYLYRKTIILCITWLYSHTYNSPLFNYCKHKKTPTNFLVRVFRLEDA